MWYLPFLVLLSGAPETQDAAPAAEVKPVDGLKVAVMSYVEARRNYLEQPTNPDAPLESLTVINFRLDGDRLGEVHRFGRAVFSELVDDTGHDLLAGVTYDEKDFRFSRVLRDRERLGNSALMTTATVGAAARGATKIAKGRGSMRVMLGVNTEEITVENPLRFRGKEIEHPRLKELGVSIRMLPAGDPATLPADDQHMAIQYGDGLEKIKTLRFYDGWLDEIVATGQPTKTNSGTGCWTFSLQSPLNEDAHIVVIVYPEVQDLRIPIVLDGFELP